MTERRRNLLTGDWVLVSSGRLQRPWQGGQEGDTSPMPEWDAACHLCPRVRRVNGDENPDYRGVHQFANDFPALSETTEAISTAPPFQCEGVSGHCEVICYTPRHDLSLAALPHDGVLDVINAWQKTTARLGAIFPWVQLFENKGAAMGASSPHPHGQVWATSVLPSAVQREDDHQRAYCETHGRILLDDYATAELGDGRRTVVRQGDWLAVVPFWAAWPYEVLVICLAERSSLVEVDAQQRADLAALLLQLLNAYDRLFGVSFPYSMGWHGLPAPGPAHWRLHAHFYPPLLRSAAVRKFMVGFELLAEVQRDLSPEQAALQLRKLC